MAAQQVFYDEEECLGFGVFVAELELVVGTSKGRKADQTVLLELLQKLQASIISTRDSAALKQHQKRCEAALYDIIYKGSCSAVSCCDHSNMPVQQQQKLLHWIMCSCGASVHDTPVICGARQSKRQYHP